LKRKIITNKILTLLVSLIIIFSCHKASASQNSYRLLGLLEKTSRPLLTKPSSPLVYTSSLINKKLFPLNQKNTQPRMIHLLMGRPSRSLILLPTLNFTRSNRSVFSREGKFSPYSSSYLTSTFLKSPIRSLQTETQQRIPQNSDTALLFKRFIDFFKSLLFPQKIPPEIQIPQLEFSDSLEKCYEVTNEYCYKTVKVFDEEMYKCAEGIVNIVGSIVNKRSAELERLVQDERRLNDILDSLRRHWRDSIHTSIQENRIKFDNDNIMVVKDKLREKGDELSDNQIHNISTVIRNISVLFERTYTTLYAADGKERILHKAWLNPTGI